MEDAADTLNTNGRNIAITGASLTLGNIDTSLPAPDGAGEVLQTAAVVSTGPGEQLESISGRLSSASDVDLYQIYLTGEGTFSATTIDGSNADTQLFLFDGDGLGVYGNGNNSECNCLQSTLPAGDPLTPTAPGIYYLGVNVFGVNPVSSSGEIFTAATSTGNLSEPTDAGGALPLVGWENVQANDLGDYTIALTGVSAASATFIEEIGNTEISNSGAITLTATNGNITAGDLKAASFSGAGGEIRLSAAADIVLHGSQVDASGVVGGGRDITLNSGGSISLNSSFLTSSTNGRGDAGKVTITAHDTVRFSGGGASSAVNSDGVGDAGGIEITTGTLSVTDGTLLRASTFGEGDAGNVRITATQSVLFTGENSQGFGSSAFSRVDSSGVGDAGGIEITTGTLSVTDWAQLSVSTWGEGDAGNVTIEASETINISGVSSIGNSSGLFVGTISRAMGEAGDIILSTPILNLREAGVINARTRNDFRGGDIEINTNRLSVTGGAQILSSSFSSGEAGTITIDATEQATISGTDPNYNSRVASFGDSVDTSGPGSAILSSALSGGRGGSVTLKTGQLQVSSGAEVSVSSLEGVAGSLNLTADSLNLNNGALRAETASGDQGNIIIDAPTVGLGNSSAIATNATGNATGGNITISADNLVARDDSDISANAEDGRGGNISITTLGLFLDLDSEITATSSRGIDGTVEIQTQVDPAQGLVSLAETPVDPGTLISKGCQEYRGSEFIITGRGGIPPHPFEMLPGEVISHRSLILK